MSSMRKPDLVALAIADLHLSLQAPACRAEGDWLEVQAGYLDQLKELAGRLEVPVLCAGDIFDRCNTTPELVNFALDNLPDGMICVAGNHDLPNHRFEDVYRSGYGVLKKAGKIQDVSSGNSITLPSGWRVYGSAWNQSAPTPKDGAMNIALIHAYIWRKGHVHGGSPEGCHFKEWGKRLQGFDVAVFGDNHQQFTANAGGCRILNCGTFLRRRSDEVGERPAVGAIHSDRSIDQWELDVSEDRFVEQMGNVPEAAVDVSAFLSQLNELTGETGLDFQEQVRRYLRDNETEPGVERVLLAAIQ